MDIQLSIMNQYMFENIDSLIEKGLLTGKKIILFGLNTSSYAAKNHLERKGYSIYAYVDNDERKRDEAMDALEDTLPHLLNTVTIQQIKEKLILAWKPEELLEPFDENVVVLIASKYYAQMCRQLQEMGYQENIHIFKIMDFFGMEQMFQNLETADCDKELTTDEIRQCQLGALKYLREICTENHLRFYLCAGTLLGAVRHQGYIPWDDDIDVAMPYPDYKKLIKILVDNNGRYQIWSPYNYKEDCFCLFARLIDSETVMWTWEYPFLIKNGINIDIFPIMGLPEREEQINSFYSKVRRLQTKFISTFVENAEQTKEIIEQRIMLQSRLLSLMEMYDYDECKKVFMITKYKEHEILPISLYDETIQLKFEDDFFPAAGDYDTYLKALYGNYMDLPPENQRTTDHNFKAFQRKSAECL